MLVVRAALKLNALRHCPVDRERTFEVRLFHPERGAGPDQLIEKGNLKGSELDLPKGDSNERKRKCL
jgi:hypothetical protein